jgi:hypothetical protein
MYSYLVTYSQKQVARYGAPYTLLGLFFFINHIVPFFIWVQVPIHYEDVLIYIRVIGALLCIPLIFREKWPASLLPYLPLYWHITVLYCLPFTTTVTFVLTAFNAEWLISVLGITMLLFVVVDWISATFISLIGVCLGLLFAKMINVSWFITSNFHTNYLLVYQLIFGLLIGLLFARRKEQTFNTLLLQNQHLSENQKAIRQELASTLTYRENLLKELKPNEAALFDDVTTAYIQQAIYHITDYLKLNVKPVSLEKLQQDLSDFYKGLAIDKPQLMFKKYTPIKEIEADLPKLKQVFINAIEYIQQNSNITDPIYITFEEAQLGHTVAHMPGHIRKLEALKVTISTSHIPPDTQPIYKIEPATASTWVPQHEGEHTLIENARIIDAHYGYLAQRSTHTQVYVLPIKLREVRGKVMELIREPIQANPEEINHPLAIELEKKLVEKLKKTSVDNKAIQRALDIIKRYHAGAKRKSGEPFFTHPITVALIVLDYCQDQDAIIAALLHDTVEDTSLSMKDIERAFGKTVAFLVGKATNLEDHRRRISLSDKENLSRILNYEDPRAALIKLADRLHNMRTIQHHRDIIKIRGIAQETLNELVPLAKKLALAQIAQELEQLSRAVLRI